MYGVPRGLHVLTHSFPPRRSADLLRSDGWRLTKQAAERLLCDTAMVAVLFDGKGHILDANDDAERWTPRQRRAIAARDRHCRAEEHTSELQSLMRISYAVLCLKKKK